MTELNYREAVTKQKADLLEQYGKLFKLFDEMTGFNCEKYVTFSGFDEYEQLKVTCDAPSFINDFMKHCKNDDKLTFEEYKEKYDGEEVHTVLAYELYCLRKDKEDCE